MDHVITHHRTPTPVRDGVVMRFYCTCTCGQDSRTEGLGGMFNTSGMSASWAAEHDPKLRNLVPVFGPTSERYVVGL